MRVQNLVGSAIVVFALGGCGRISFQSVESETLDAGEFDASRADAGSVDASYVDAGSLDGGLDLSFDAGSLDASFDADVDLGTDASPFIDADVDLGDGALGAIDVLASPMSGLATNEGGSTATFSVVLSAAPIADTTLPIVTLDATEGTVSPSALVFTSANWNVAQVVTVTGVDDASSDGDVAFEVNVGPATGSDPRFASIAAIPIGVLNADDEPPSAIRVSVTSSGTETSLGGRSCAISADGDHVAFLSQAPDLVAGHAISTEQVFVHSVSTGATAIASVTSADGDADASSLMPAISADGRYVAFVSDATNLSSMDANGVSDVFVRDLVMGTTSLVSVNLMGTDAGSGISSAASISEDGNVIAFMSRAPDITGDPTFGVDQVYARDMALGATTRLDTGRTGYSAQGQSFNPAISGSGQFTAFTTLSNFNSYPGVGVSAYMHDAMTGMHQLISKSSAGVVAGSNTEAPSVSRDGRYVAFTSYASDLVLNDSNGNSDCFLRDTLAGTTSRVSLSSSGREANGVSGQARVSADGSVVVFTTFATNIAPSHGAGAIPDDVVYDVATGALRIAALDPMQPSVPGEICVSGDGTRIAFDSNSALVTDDTNSSRDVYVRSTFATKDLLVGVRDVNATTEAGGVVTLRMRLSYPPNHDVTVTLTSTDTSEGTVSATPFTFTPLNWNIVQTADVTGADDALNDGDRTYTITFDLASTDVAYDTLLAAPILLINTDND